MLNENEIKNSSSKVKQYLAALTVSFGAFAVGTVLSWTSVALPYVTNNQQNSAQDFPTFKITHEEEALVGALLTVGALVSAIPSGCLADKVGRKKAILITMVPLLVNWGLISYVSNTWLLLLARFIAGMGVGGYCVVAPMYLAEIADASCRGTFGSFFQLFICAGILFTCLLGPITTWTSLSLILAVVPGIFICIFLFQPESPLYLIKKERISDAEVTLRYLRGPRYQVKKELMVLQKDIEDSCQKSRSLKDILTTKRYKKSLIAVLGVLLFQQFSGINALIFYTVPIFQASGSTLSPTLAAITVNIVQVLATYVSSLIVERAGRKLYLFISAAGMFLCLVTLATFFYVKSFNSEISQGLGLVPIISMVVFMASYSIGFGPIPWMLLGELFAPEIKAVATGVAILANWIFAFLVTFFFPILNLKLGTHVTFYVFSCFMLVALVFIRYVIPESKGKSLMEIQKMLEN